MTKAESLFFLAIYISFSFFQDQEKCDFNDSEIFSIEEKITTRVNLIINTTFY